MPSANFPGVFRRGEAYVAAPYNPATKSKIHLGTRPSAAEAYELIREWKAGGARSRTIAGIRSSFLDLYVDNDATGLVATTRRGYRNYTAKLEGRFGENTPDDLYDRFDLMQHWALEQSTVCVQSNFTMLEWARKHRLCKSNPLEGVSGRAPKRRSDKVIIRSSEDLDRLAACARATLPGHKGEVMEALIYVAYGSMLRPAHLFGLRWQDIDFTRRRIRVPAVKRGRVQDVALLPVARKGFDLLFRGAPDDFVFTNTHGGPLRKQTIANWWPPVRAAFGEPSMRFYDLKTAGTTRLIQAGARREQLRVQLTHSDKTGDTLARHYVDIDAEDALAHVEAIDSVAAALEIEAHSVASDLQIGGDSAC